MVAQPASQARRRIHNTPHVLFVQLVALPVRLEQTAPYALLVQVGHCGYRLFFARMFVFVCAYLAPVCQCIFTDLMIVCSCGVPAGTNTGQLAGASACSVCAPGLYSPDGQMCRICPPGSHTDTLANAGGSSCSICREGRTSVASTQNCTATSCSDIKTKVVEIQPGGYERVQWPQLHSFKSAALPWLEVYDYPLRGWTLQDWDVGVTSTVWSGLGDGIQPRYTLPSNDDRDPTYLPISYSTNASLYQRFKSFKYFLVRLMFEFEVTVAGEYKFSAACDSGCILFVGNVSLVNQSLSIVHAAVNLRVGWHSFILAYHKSDHVRLKANSMTQLQVLLKPPGESAYMNLSSASFNIRPVDLGNFTTTGGTECRHCPAGQSDVHLRGEGDTRSSIHPCRTCEAGQFSEGKGQLCQVCPSGSVTTTDAGLSLTTCTVCPSGKASAQATSACKACSSSTLTRSFSNATGVTTCEKCPEGYITSTNKDGDTVCKLCPPGMFSNNATNSTVCRLCPGGSQTNTLRHPGARLCITCASGWYSERSTVACHKCPAGSMVVSNNGSNSSTLRLFGITDPLATTCEDCPGGRYSPHSAIACADCAPGFYAPFKTQRLPRGGHGACLECSAGAVTDKLKAAGASECTACEAGQYSNRSETPCQVCPTGSVTNTLHQPYGRNCTACSAGQYSSRPIEACADCSPGFTDSDHDPRTPCDKCAPGRENIKTAAIGAAVYLPTSG